MGKAIDNTNPNEALECLAKIKDTFGCDMVYYHSNSIDTIKQALIKAQEQEKVLKIIFEKGIDIGWLRQCKTVEEYNYHCEAKHLTQEEFDTLKREVKE